MLPKRLKERIEKLEHLDHFEIPSRRAQDIKSSLSISQQKQILEKVVEMSKQTMGVSDLAENLGKFTEQMEERDRYVLLEIPTLSSQTSARTKQIKLWLGDVTRRVFSVSFNYFQGKIFDTQTMKAFCSESIMGNLISLSKKNHLNPSDYTLINNHLRDELLPYFLLRYPQSNNKQVNQTLNREISLTDSINSNENNLFLKSKIQFSFRETGKYDDLIMKFINYLLDLPEKKIENVTDCLFDSFNEKMENIFTSVYNRQWTESNLYDQYMKNDKMDLETFKSKVQELEKTKNAQNMQRGGFLNLIGGIGEIGLIGSSAKAGNSGTGREKNGDSASNYHLYEDNVKEYTKYAINRKISKNVEKYSSENIEHMNLKVNDPSVLRIIVKWCEELEEKFSNPKYFVDRDEPFVMMNGNQVEMNNEIREKLAFYASLQWISLKKFLGAISQNISVQQSSLSFSNLMHYSTNQLPQFQESLIKFATRNTDNVNHYATAYLNRLIHALLNISQQIYSFHLKYWAEWSQPPQFITFSISDLMRCKCYSKEKQIIRIYKELQTQSLINPQVLRIVKVKNRLNRGTKDILINFMLYEEALCEIQLAIKIDVSGFILYSDKFNHYIYELKRSIFGPVCEVCSIWSSIDERVSVISDNKIRFIEKVPHECPPNHMVKEILPFTCNNCYKHFTQTVYIINHQRCGKCNQYWTCARCRIKNLNEEQLKAVLKLSDKDVVRRIDHIDKKLPQYLIAFQLESSEVIGLKYRKFEVEKSIFLARKQKELYLKQFFSSEQDVKNNQSFLDNLVLFELRNKSYQLEQLTLQQILDYCTVNQIRKCYQQKNQALRITKKNITSELILSIDDSRGQSNIKTFSFPENKIEAIDKIALRFCNTRILNLNNNGLKSLKGIGNMRNLTDVYVGFNEFREIIELDQLENLRYIQLGNNQFAPQFRCDLSNLSKLASLTLVCSNLVEFPLAICDIPNLKLLWLFQNKIRAIPAEIRKLKALENLNIENNEVEEIPEQFYELIQIQKLELGCNKVRKLSSKISRFRGLTELSLKYNKIEDAPVEKILSLPNLSNLTLDEDQCLSLNIDITQFKFINVE